MAWYEFIGVFILLASIISLPFILWLLEKPERELRKKRLEAEWKFYHAAGYVFEHIASNIGSYDSTLNNIESALISIDGSISSIECSLFAKEEK